MVCPIQFQHLYQLLRGILLMVVLPYIIRLMDRLSHLVQRTSLELLSVFKVHHLWLNKVLNQQHLQRLLHQLLLHLKLIQPLLNLSCQQLLYLLIQFQLLLLNKPHSLTFLQHHQYHQYLLLLHLLHKQFQPSLKMEPVPLLPHNHLHHLQSQDQSLLQLHLVNHQYKCLELKNLRKKKKNQTKKNLKLKQ